MLPKNDIFDIMGILNTLFYLLLSLLFLNIFIFTSGEWYLISATVIGCVALVVAIGMFLVKYLKKRLQERSNPEIRLSAAYREGFLRDDSNPHRRLESSFHTRPNNSSTQKQNEEASNRQPQHSDLPTQRLMHSASNSNKYGGVNPQNRSADDKFIRSKKGSIKENKIEMESKGKKYVDTFIEVVNSQNSDYKQDEEIHLKETYNTTNSMTNTSDTNNINKSITNTITNNDNLILPPPTIHLCVQYNHHHLLLSVTIHRITNLPRMGRHLSCDPYIKLQLLPDDSLQVVEANHFMPLQCCSPL